MNTKNTNDTPRFNIADVIIIIAIIAVVTALALRIYNIVGVKDDSIELKVEFEVEGVSEENFSLKENSKLYYAKDDSLVGYVEEFYMQNSFQYAYNENGELVRATVPGKKDIKGTIVLTCVKTENGFYLGGTHLLSEGETITLYTTTREMNFKIVKITMLEGSEAEQTTPVNTVVTAVTTAKNDPLQK